MVNDKLPEDLPVEIVVHELPADEQICPVCDGELHVMGTETIRRELKFIPAKAVIVEHVQKVYGCRDCEQNECAATIVKANVPTAVIKGGFASAEAIAHIKEPDEQGRRLRRFRRVFCGENSERRKSL